MSGWSEADLKADQGYVIYIEQSLTLPALDYILKCSHSFNLLDARGVISVTERTRYIGRIRNLARAVASIYFEQREQLGFPLDRSGAAQSETVSA